MMFGEDREVRRYEMSMLYFDNRCDMHTFSGVVAVLYKWMRMSKSGKHCHPFHAYSALSGRDSYSMNNPILAHIVQERSIRILIWNW